MPLAFFCTLFFRHRKKSVSAPWDGKFQFAPESARQAPLRGNCLRQSCCLMLQAGGAFRSPPCTPFGESAYPHRTGVCASGRVGGFPRGKQSAQPALPCVPLVVCLNSGSLTAFGGCIHWIPASLRSLPDPFGSPPEAIERPIGLQALLPRRSRRVNPRQGEFLTAKLSLVMPAGGFPLAPCTPSGSRRIHKARVCACGHSGGFPRDK